MAAGQGFGGTRRRVNLPKAADLVADDLRKAIASGAFADGEPLPPGTVLLERYGISRPTLREALRVLASENLITLSARTQGARVTLPSTEGAARYAGVLMQLRGTTLLDLERTRGVIEAPAARLLAEAADRAAVVEKLRAALDAERKAIRSGDTVAAGRASLEFHDLVVELSGNVTLTACFALVQSVVQRHMDLRLSAGVDAGDSEAHLQNLNLADRAHAKLIRLIDDGDADGAEAYWRKHAEAVADALVDDDEARRIVDIV
jgi:DNA-binding FadR family transcriptional regulator